MDKEWFENRSLFIATKHQKETVIAPKLFESFGIKSIVSSNFDTDQFGMFTGQINREIRPYDTAKLKCEFAREQFGYDLVLASEGSFFMQYGFIRVNHELLLLKDYLNEIEIIADVTSQETNFNQKKIKIISELHDFLTSINFPKNAVILSFYEEEEKKFFKDISQISQLEKIVKDKLESGIEVYIETDMRAMNNPIRMKVISEAADKMISKMQSNCPHCYYPGFSVYSYEKGLPCEICNFPTNAILIEIYKCKNCDYQKKVEFPHGKKYQEAMFCDVCNP